MTRFLAAVVAVVALAGCASLNSLDAQVSTFSRWPADRARWAAHKRFPISPCNLCGSQSHLQRVKVGQMLRDWEREYPGRIDNLFHAMSHVVPSHLLDRNLFPFETLQATGVADPAGDRAFDPDDACGSSPAALPIRQVS